MAPAPARVAPLAALGHGSAAPGAVPGPISAARAAAQGGLPAVPVLASAAPAAAPDPAGAAARRLVAGSTAGRRVRRADLITTGLDPVVHAGQDAALVGMDPRIEAAVTSAT